MKDRWESNINVWLLFMKNCAALFIPKHNYNVVLSSIPILVYLFIYFQDRSVNFAAAKYADWSWEYINRSQIHSKRLKTSGSRTQSTDSIWWAFISWPSRFKKGPNSVLCSVLRRRACLLPWSLLLTRRRTWSPRPTPSSTLLSSSSSSISRWNVLIFLCRLWIKLILSAKGISRHSPFGYVSSLEDNVWLLGLLNIWGNAQIFCHTWGGR